MKAKIVTGLWNRRKKVDRTKFMVGRVARERLLELVDSVKTDTIGVVVWKNGRKEGAEDPHWNLCISDYVPYEDD